MVYTGVQQSDSGVYSCVARNEFGESYASAVLKVIDPNDSTAARRVSDKLPTEPTFTQSPGQPRAQLLSCNSIQLTWSAARLTPAAEQDYQIAGYTIEYFAAYNSRDSRAGKWQVAATDVQSTAFRLQELPQQSELVFIVRPQLNCRNTLRCQSVSGEPSTVSESIQTFDCGAVFKSRFDLRSVLNEHSEKIRAELLSVQTTLLRTRSYNTTAFKISWTIDDPHRLANVTGLLLFYRLHPYKPVMHPILDPAALPFLADTPVEDHVSHRILHGLPHHHNHHRRSEFKRSNSFVPHHHHHQPHSSANAHLNTNGYTPEIELQRAVRHHLPIRGSDSAKLNIQDYHVQLVNTTSDDSALIGGLKPFTMYQVFAIPFHRLGMYGPPSNLVFGHTAEALPDRAPARIQIRVYENPSNSFNGIASNAGHGLLPDHYPMTQESSSSESGRENQISSHQMHSLLTNSLSSPSAESRRLIVEIIWSDLPTEHWRGLQQAYRLDFQLISPALQRKFSDTGFVLHVSPNHLLRNGRLLPNNSIQLTNLTMGDSYLMRLSACTSAGCGVSTAPAPLKVLPGFSYTLLADLSIAKPTAKDGQPNVHSGTNESNDLLDSGRPGIGNNGNGLEVITVNNKHDTQHLLLGTNGLQPLLILLAICFSLFVIILMLALFFFMLKRKDAGRFKKAVGEYISVHLPDANKSCKVISAIEKAPPLSFNVINGAQSSWSAHHGSTHSSNSHSTQSSDCHTSNNQGQTAPVRRGLNTLPPLPATNQPTTDSSHYAEVEGHSMVTFGGYTCNNHFDTFNLGSVAKSNQNLPPNANNNNHHVAEPYATTTLMMLNSAFNRERELIQDGGSSDQSGRFTGQQILSQAGYASAYPQHSTMASHSGHSASGEGHASDSGSDVYGISRPTLNDHFRNTAATVNQFHSSVESVAITAGNVASSRPALSVFSSQSNLVANRGHQGPVPNKLSYSGTSNGYHSNPCSHSNEQVSGFFFSFAIQNNRSNPNLVHFD